MIRLVRRDILYYTVSQYVNEFSNLIKNKNLNQRDPAGPLDVPTSPNPPALSILSSNIPGNNSKYWHFKNNLKYILFNWVDKKKKYNTTAQTDRWQLFL